MVGVVLPRHTVGEDDPGVEVIHRCGREKSGEYLNIAQRVHSGGEFASFSSAAEHQRGKGSALRPPASVFVFTAEGVAAVSRNTSNTDIIRIGLFIKNT